MMILGLNMLGNMNKEATSQSSLGMPFWRLLVASGCLAIVIGFMNIVAVSHSFIPSNSLTNNPQSYVFCDRSRNVTARRVRSRGAIALSEADAESQYESYDPKHKAFTINTHHTGSTTSRTHVNYSPPMRQPSPQMSIRPGTPPVDCGSPQAPQLPTSHLGQFEFSPMRVLRSARNSILPAYSNSSPISPPKPGFFSHRPSSSIYSRTTYGGEPGNRKKFWQRQKDDEEVPHVPEISAPLNVNPQFAHLVRPNLAHHPSVRRPEAEYDNV